MIVVALTAFVGLALVAFFVLLFIDQMSIRHDSTRDSLLPLEEDHPVPASSAKS